MAWSRSQSANSPLHITQVLDRLTTPSQFSSSWNSTPARSYCSRKSRGLLNYLTKKLAVCCFTLQRILSTPAHASPGLTNVSKQILDSGISFRKFLRLPAQSPVERGPAWLGDFCPSRPRTSSGPWSGSRQRRHSIGRAPEKACGSAIQTDLWALLGTRRRVP